MGRAGKEENEQRQAGRQPPPAQFNPTLLLDALEVEGLISLIMAITMNTVILRTPTGLLKILEIVSHIHLR